MSPELSAFDPFTSFDDSRRLIFFLRCTCFLRSSKLNKLFFYKLSIFCHFLMPESPNIYSFWDCCCWRFELFPRINLKLDFFWFQIKPFVSWLLRGKGFLKEWPRSDLKISLFFIRIQNGFVPLGFVFRDNGSFKMKRFGSRESGLIFFPQVCNFRRS